ncbi:DUF1570 domain-containing protein [Sphingomonas sp. PL-96]|uniref:DUF1570 domain-containing protein n=1 Tax=Sphingomonas sp. PL-96 TaxID=2887201 RepID=UPI001E52A86F|nr:DUF1570 domain-containing protein [Sphingomonas sp. PL-96]MCC2976743.1 DUF1570 domain-containing protein [Sphingomonas sp. PL-96]
MHRSMWLASLLVGAALMGAAPARAEWHEATSKHFIVYANGDADDVKEQAEELERFDGVFRYFQQIPTRPEDESNKLTVYVVPNDSAVRRLYGANSRNIAGFYEGRASGSVAFTPARAPGSDAISRDQPQIVLFHEYAHHLLLGNFASAFPAWFSEGYAEFLSTVRFDKDAAWVGGAAQHRAYDLLRGQPFSAEKLFAANMRSLRPDEMSALYARGWLLTHYIFVAGDSKRRDQFTRYLEAINRGTPSVDAAREAFGDLRALDKELDARLRSAKLPAFRFGLDKLPQPVVQVRALRPGEKAMIDLRMRSDRGVDRTTAQPILKDAIPIGERYPDDPAVQGWLAEMALDAGRYDLAEAAADRALAIDARSSQALVYKGQVHLRRAREARSTDPAVWKEARSWLLKANAIDSNDAYTLMLFYSSFGMAGVPATANAKDALERAQQLVPQDPALRFAYAHQSLLDGKIDEAKRALRPLAYSAHAAPDNPAARLLTALEDKAATKAVLDALGAQQKAEAAGSGDE